ncbi:MAG: F0F1 ATP synthase subunit B [Erysipelotrichaceae bacterium]|nr:F0F1 ATP synthase subunit B [Erysipelotrichaceae bacterium]
MNVDVQGALFPNVLTMLTQLLSTLIIFLAVKKFLWKPVKNILAKRSEKMKESLDNAFKQNEEATKNLEDSRKELNEAKASSKEIIDAARIEATNLKNEIVADAKKQAQAKLDSAESKIEQRKSEVRDELHDEMVNVALAAVSKLLEDKATSSDDEKALDKYIKEVNGK